MSVMENRWQPMPAAGPRSQRPADQPLRCCFIGGMAIHKGMHVVQAALLLAKPCSRPRTDHWIPVLETDESNGCGGGKHRFA